MKEVAVFANVQFAVGLWIYWGDETPDWFIIMALLCVGCNLLHIFLDKETWNKIRM